MEMVNLVLEEAEERMKKAVEATRREFNSIRTGRASPALLDRITVDAYGTHLPLNQSGHHLGAGAPAADGFAVG